MYLHNNPLPMAQKLIALTSCAILGSALLSSPTMAQSNIKSFKTRGIKTVAVASPSLQIEKPERNSAQTEEVVSISVKLDSQMDADTLKLMLNGKVMDSDLLSPDCDDKECTVTAEVTYENGLREGSNTLRADVSGEVKGHFNTRTTRFHYEADPVSNASLGATTGNQVTNYNPSSIGINVVGNSTGQQPWITLSTGRPAGVIDPIANAPALKDGLGNIVDIMQPYTDKKLVTPSCSGSIYQAYILDRTNPTNMLASVCSNSESEMESNAAGQLGRSLGASDLIVFGTVGGVFADASLDTSGIGGTNWPKATVGHPERYPSYYLIIGVKGATPGTAHENSLWHANLPGNNDTPYTWAASLQGNLLPDSNGNYNFISGGSTAFTLKSGPNASLTVGSKTYTPPSGSGSGFWLMVLDRTYLAPITTYSTKGFPTVQKAACDINNYGPSCGYFFSTLDTNAELFDEILASVSPQNLVFITTVGCPTFTPMNPLMATTQQQAYGEALGPLGGNKYAPLFMNSSTSQGCNYALASINDGNHATFGTHAALSWDYFSAQKQLGQIHGKLGIDNSGFYDVVGQDQMVKTKTGTIIPSVDYTFDRLASTMRVDWPQSDTTGKLNAYYDISNQLLTDPQVNEKGANNYDIRYFYTDQDGIPGKLNSILDSRMATGAPNMVTKSSWDTATDAEFNAVRLEILSEIQSAYAATSYLSGGNGNGGMRGMLNGQTASILSTALDAASDVGSDVDQATETSMSFQTGASDWMNLAAGALSTFAGLADPEDAAMMGLMSSTLWTGSAAGAQLTPSTDTETSPNVIAGPATTYDQTLDSFAKHVTDYQANLLASFDAASDAVLSDSTAIWWAGDLVNTSGSGWQISSNGAADTIGQGFKNGAKMNLWMSILPRMYGIRQNLATNSPNPNTWGSEYSINIVGVGPEEMCGSLYNNVPTTSMASLPGWTGAGNQDVFVLAAGPTWQSGQDIAVSQNLSTLLTTDQSVTFPNNTGEPGLNIPAMQLLANGPFIYSNYAKYSVNTCTP